METFFCSKSFKVLTDLSVPPGRINRDYNNFFDAAHLKLALVVCNTDPGYIWLNKNLTAT